MEDRRPRRSGQAWAPLFHPSDRYCNHTDDEIESDCAEQCPTVSEVLEHVKRREQHAGHRAERVRAVEQRDIAASSIVIGLDRTRDRRQRSPHQIRRDAENKR